MFVTGCSQRTVNVADENISFVNAPSDYEVSDIVKSIGSVTVVGPQASLDSLQAADVYAVVDLANIDVTAAEQTVSARLGVKNSNDCWVYGEYSVTIN